MVSQSRTSRIRRWENRTNAWLREKRDSISSVLLCGLPLLALQLFRRLVLLLFLVLDPPLLSRLVLDPSLVCCLSLLVVEPLLLCCFVLCPLQFLDLQLFCCPFLCSVQLFLILHLQLSEHLNKPCQMSLSAVQPALQSLFVWFRLSANCPTKPTANGLLIQHSSILAHSPAIMLEKRLTWALRNAVALLQLS